MKADGARRRYGDVDAIWSGPAPAKREELVKAAPTLTEIAARESEFLWLTLQRMGIRREDCPDVMQNVLVVVHKKHSSYDPSQPLRAWLYGICAKEASSHRRRAWVRREQPSGAHAISEDVAADAAHDPEAAASSREERARLEAMLNELDPDKRAVLVMFEVEERSCDEIAEACGVPVGTVFSRLSHARKAFRAVIDRWTRRETRGGVR